MPAKKVRKRDLSGKVAELGPTGQDLWDLLKKTTSLLDPSGEMTAAATVLALEACRAADRLDDLEDLIRGRREGHRLLHFATDHLDVVDGEPYEVNLNIKVSVDPVLAEARQQQNTLRQLLSSLGHAHLGAKKNGGGILDQLAARRAARQDRGATASH